MCAQRAGGELEALDISFKCCGVGEVRLGGGINTLAKVMNGLDTGEMPMCSKLFRIITLGD